MGEDLSLPERNAIRTPMQWSDARNGGFSTAAKKKLMRPLVSGGPFGFEQCNVDAQRDDDASLLAWFERLLRARRECGELGANTAALLDTGHEEVLGLRYTSERTSLVVLSNLSDEPRVVDLTASVVDEPRRVLELFANRRYDTRPDALDALELDGLGYRWLRLDDRP